MRTPDLLSYALTRVRDEAAVVFGERSLTFAELDARADRLARAFEQHGLKRGDRVALLARNELEYIEIQIAAQRAGVILVPLNFRLAVAELRKILSDCQPRLLIHGPELAATAAQLELPALWSIGVEYDVRLHELEPRRGRRPMLDASVPNSILYTSGTTGSPKGAVISNGALWARVTSWSVEAEMLVGDTFVCPLPMFHVAAHAVYAFLLRGATVVLLPGFDVAETVSAVERHEATHVVFVPTMLPRLLEHVAKHPARFDSLRYVLYGASPIAPEVLRRALPVLGCKFWQGYGLTEAVAVSALRPEDHDPDRHPERLASAGRNAIGYEVRVVDADGAECPPGEVGEILIAGPGVIDGYWNAPELTASVLVDGWLHSGDLGYRSDDGYLYLTDRLKDMIVSGGENIYSREVEDALHEHPGVLEVAVVGIPNAEWGEAVHAVVVPREGIDLDPDEVIAHCRSLLAAYKVPKSVEISEAPLPKNAAEKILKRDIRERYWQGAERGVN
jgi:acyl-CoA synthetase (AMP-forming)/AMP-acid ligase II